MTVTALLTTYSGITFRSRLEADWAHTLDGQRIPWDYEPEGYQLSDGTKYLPDFYLPTLRAWMEIKGAHMDRFSKVEQFAADLWNDSGTGHLDDPQAPMVLLGQSPRRREPWHAADLGALEPFMVGVRGPGQMYTVGFSACPSCRRHIIFSHGHESCRACGARNEHVQDEIRGTWMELQYTLPFLRVPRPFTNQGGRR